MKISKYLVLILITFCLFGCKNQELDEYTKTMNYFGNEIKIKIYVSSNDKAKKAFNDIEEIYAKYEDIIDRNNPNSEISYIYANNTKDKKIKVSSEMNNLIQYGIKWYKASNGLLSFNTGDLIDLWDEYYDENLLPAKERIKNIDTSIDNIIIKDNVLDNKHYNLSFDQFIQGYTNSLVKEYLKKMHIDYYFINSSSEVMAGKNNENNDYIIALSNPFNDELLKTLQIQNKYISTKSIYHNAYEYDNELYSNIVNAKDKTMGNKMVSVTVISNEPDVSDMVANMLFLVDYDEGLKIAKKYNVEAIWCYYDEFGNEIIQMTNNM